MEETADDFDSVRSDPDPVSRGHRATRLLTIYQQRAAELARLRKAAIEEAHQERGMSYTEIAQALGITKGRIAQIRASDSRFERAFFGVGPVSVGVPCRYRTTDREHPLVAAEDFQTGEQVENLLTGLAFAVTRYQIEPDMAMPPRGDTVVICGPKSAPIAAALIGRDPALSMVEDGGRWWIERRATGERAGSPSDDGPGRSADVAYVARHREPGRIVVHIAGIHAIGSLGAAHYLTAHLANLFRLTADEPFSMIVRASCDGLAITGSEIAGGPYLW
jgi:hypothetical protein